MTDFAVDEKTGIWLCETTEPHSFDPKLAQALAVFFRQEKARLILDVGCGAGEYVDFMARNDLIAVGVDGNPRTSQFNAICGVADLTQPWPKTFLPYDWILCLEVGEHIPPEHEQQFIDNLDQNCAGGIVLSWFPREGEGIGHFNPRPNDYVKEQFLKRGFVSDEMAQENLRAEASLWWFLESLLVFRRI